MSITSFLETQARNAQVHTGSPYGAMPLEQQFLRIESAIDFLGRAKKIAYNASTSNLSNEEIRFSNSILDGAPSEFKNSSVRMESYSNQNTVGGLKYRAEGIVDTIVDGIASFFRWIGEAFSKLFGGSGGDDAGGGSSGAAAAATATTETVAAASSNGVDEFLFKADHALFKTMNLNDTNKCREYYDAVAKSTKALVEINAKAIELSKKGVKDYQGDFAKDIIAELKGFAVPKTVGFVKQSVGSAIPDGTYFAYPSDFLKARVIVFGEGKVELPNVNEADGSSGGDKTGTGYTPKDVYIKASEWKALVDNFANSGKLFYDASEDFKKVGEDYNKLAEQTKSWKDMEPEEVRKVGVGLKELNKVASFAYKAVKHQQSSVDKLFKSLRDIAENDLRSQAKVGRKEEADKAEAEKKKAASPGGGEATGPMIP